MNRAGVRGAEGGTARASEAEFLADLHVHSRFSRATSRDCTLEGLAAAAQRKGVRVVATGDFTHPEWRGEIRRKLVESGPGLYRLSGAAGAPVVRAIPPACRAPVDFALSAEISCIYKRDGRVRKVHTLVLASGLDAAERVSAALGRIGNLGSDGRPILGLDARDLLALVMECDPDACVIPAHIWTPWFSMLGARSGFDSPDECYGDLVRHITAMETGLSSDPAMNWRVSNLDRFSLVSNSDLHSPANLGRNANRFRGEPDYFRMRAGLRDKDPAVFGGTIDLFPEEGKYHLDGHRACGVRLEPAESAALNGLCPACGGPLVLGVLHRVTELADRPPGARPESAAPSEYIVPLAELLSEILGVGVKSKKTVAAYERLLEKLGPEFHILRELDPDALDAEEPRLLGEAIRRVRAGRVSREAGYDGEYGRIRVFADDERVEPRRGRPIEARRPQAERTPARAPLPPARAARPRRTGS